jgi:translation initiation factor IF-2
VVTGVSRISFSGGRPAEESASPAPAEVGEGRVIHLKPPVIVRDLADRMGVKPNLLIAELMRMNVFASINQKVDWKQAVIVAEKHGFVLEPEKPPPPPPTPPKPAVPPTSKSAKKRVDIAPQPKEVVPDVITRPPVVTFMGHVDHGKTSLLDKIRKANVAAGEAGGITQHIGAYSIVVPMKDGKTQGVTFLDTPGHEAFTAMRARGANLTDIAVIVIDGVDGIMPQTREAIHHAKAAQAAKTESKMAIMVAINKCDLRAANPDRVKQQLQQAGLVPEEWGGNVICCPVSALTGQGIDNLLENIAVQAEILELRARNIGPASGFVVEAQLEPGRGPTATLLVREGVLRIGDPIVCGPYCCKVKSLMNAAGQRVKEARASDAVKVLGLPGVPEAGVEFSVYPSDREARDESERRLADRREENLASAAPKRFSIDDLLSSGDEAGGKTLALIVKTDVQGSLEAIHHALDGIRSDKVSIKLILSGIGNITVNDVLLAKASKAMVVGFNVTKDGDVTAAAKREGVEVRFYSIIYELVDAVTELMAGLLEPMMREAVIGHAQVRQVFDITKKGNIAGCIVTDGKVSARARVRVKRRGDVLYAGAVSSLRRFQNDASVVHEGQECGIRLDNYGDFQPGDILEFYEVEKIAQTL